MSGPEQQDVPAAYRVRDGKIESRPYPADWEPATIKNVTTVVADTSVLSTHQEGGDFFCGTVVLFTFAAEDDWTFSRVYFFSGPDAIAKHTRFMVGLLGEDAIVSGLDVAAALRGRAVEIRRVADEYEFRLT